ncbi:MAG: MBL fold metallo-hydrolase [Actinobacteria bacterium]|nr:MBL fold metallo-hydrolase [Actinomycetota bacterium]
MSGLPVAAKWFERTTVGDDVTLLIEPHAHRLLRCNIWHVRGRDRDLVIDTGLGVSSLREEIADLLDKALVAVATHIHYDHVGGLHEFDERWMHNLEAPRMNPYREFNPLVRARIPDPVLEELARTGYPIEQETLIDALPHAGYDPAAFETVPATATRALTEGDAIDLGNRRFEVLHLPGHSPGSIGLWEAATGVLFSGDAVYDGPLLDNLPDSDVANYVCTMRRLRELPVSAVHAGHEASFGRERLLQLVDAYLAARGA